MNAYLTPSVTRADIGGTRTQVQCIKVLNTESQIPTFGIFSGGFVRRVRSGKELFFATVVSIELFCVLEISQNDNLY